MIIVNKEHNDAYNTSHITNFYIGSDGCSVKVSAGIVMLESVPIDTVWIVPVSPSRHRKTVDDGTTSEIE